MKKLLLVLAFCVPAFLASGCATTPKTLDQQIAVGLATATWALESADIALKANKITVADAEHIQKTARSSRDALNAARVLMATNPGAAATAVEKQEALLRGLEAYMALRGIKR